MLNDPTVANEANELIITIKKFWNSSVTEIKLVSMTDKPFDMFTLSMKIYSKYEVLMEYDRGTLSIKVKMQNQFIVLSRLTDEQIYRGFEGYKPEKLLHNFKALDKVLQSL
jgi:hypothetical protein